MRARIVTALGVAAVAFGSARCEGRAPTPKPSPSSASSASSVAPVRSAPPSSTAAPKRASDCEQKHWDNPWRPRQTAEHAIRNVACKNSNCVTIEALASNGEPCPDRCRHVTITPRVSSPDPTRNERIQTLLDAQISEVTNDDCWLTFLDYTVHHDAHGILDITFRMSGSGAYPSTQTAHVTIELETGSRLRATDVFSSRMLPALTGAMNAKVLAAWRRASKEHAEVFRGRETPRFASEHLDAFIVHPDGVTFYFDYGLPHALELAMPASEFPFSKSEIERFIDPKGPLRFLRDGARSHAGTKAASSPPP